MASDEWYEGLVYLNNLAEDHRDLRRPGESEMERVQRLKVSAFLSEASEPKALPGLYENTLSLILSRVQDAIDAGLTKPLLDALDRWMIESIPLTSELSRLSLPSEKPSPSTMAAMTWALHRQAYDYFAEMPYEEYLQTTYWKCVRALVLERDGNHCRVCTATTNLHVHHRTYEHRGREHEHLDDLTTLCAICHAKAHDKA